MAGKFALIIGNSHYEDSSLGRLTAPEVDVRGLEEVLKAPDIGRFDDVTTLIDRDFASVRRAVARFYDLRQRDDLLFLYFSGHGVKDEQGHLYLALRDTDSRLLAGTAIETLFISGQMDRSFSKHQVLVLDCCHSGAFAHGTKAAQGLSVGTGEAFEGTGLGRVILTATDSTQYAFDGNQVIGHAQHSLFTHFLIDGLKTGAADRNDDGVVTVDELYEHVREQVLNTTPRQTPQRWAYRQLGEIVLAKNPYAKPSKLPAHTSDIRRTEKSESDVFISYAREDQAKARLLAEILRARGWSVWWDRKIAPGEAFDVVIERELGICKCAIVLWSKRSVNATWVRNEARRASKRKVLVPILIDEVDPPLEFENLQAADLTAWEGTPDHPELEAIFARIGALSPIPSARSEADERERQRVADAKRREAEEAQRLRAEAAARQRAEAERLQAEAAARQRAEAERKRAEEERQRAEEAKRRQAEEAERQRVAEAKRREAEEAERLRAEAAARQRAETERLRAEAAARQRAEAERKRAEEERQRAEEAKRRQAEEAERQRIAEARRREAEEARRQRAEAERQRAEEERQRAEAERRDAQIGKLVARATKRLKKRDYDGAVALVDSALQLDARHAEAVALRAAIEQARQEPQSPRSPRRFPRSAVYAALAGVAIVLAVTLLVMPRQRPEPTVPSQVDRQVPPPLPTKPVVSDRADATTVTSSPSAPVAPPPDVKRSDDTARLQHLAGFRDTARRHQRTGRSSQALDAAAEGLKIDAKDAALLGIVNALFRDAQASVDRAKQEARTARRDLAATPEFTQASERHAEAVKLHTSGDDVAAVRLLWAAADDFTTAAQRYRQFAAKAPEPKSDAVEVAPPQPEPARAKPQDETAPPTDKRPDPPVPEPPPNPPAPVPRDSIPGDEQRIRQLLNDYKAAYEQMDAAAVSRHQPSLSQSQLANTFKQYRSFAMSIADVKISLAGNSAVVTCIITTNIRPRVGDPQSFTRSTMLRLQKTGESWVIVERR